MPRPVRPWFRFYVETFPDLKVRRLQPAERWVWAAVLGAARESPEAGRLMIAEGVPMTVAELASYADVPPRTASKALDAMARMGMIVWDGEVITVPKFTSRQYESDDVTARTRKHRERSNNVPTDDVGTFQRGSEERSRERRRNTPETETETETEKKTSSSSARTRATRIPEDWLPGAAEVAWQREQGISDLLARRELPKFRDYWAAVSGDRGRKADWPATWRNWLRRAVENEPKSPGAARPAVPEW